MSRASQLLERICEAEGMVRGDQLPPQVQEEAKRRFVHRFTGDHMPNWARKERPDGGSYKPQFRDDKDWLANTHFRVTKTGRLHARASSQSNPTWPLGK